MQIEQELTWEDIQKVEGFSSYHLSPESVQAIKRYQNRFEIPKGLTKKEYKVLLDKTQSKINESLARMRALGPGDNILADIEREQWVERKVKINKILKLHEEWGVDHKASVEKAKLYPIENMINFNSYGYTKCIFHNERTPSLRLYSKLVSSSRLRPEAKVFVVRVSIGIIQGPHLLIRFITIVFPAPDPAINKSQIG